MEWQGIDLGRNSQQEYWYKQLIWRAVMLFAVSLIAIMLALLIFNLASELKQQNQQIQHEIIRLKQQENTLNTQISQLQQQGENEQFSTLSAAQINRFIQLLQQLPFQGSLEFAYLDAKAQIHLNLNTELKVFQQLEQALNHQQLPYKIDQLQTNENHQLEVKLTILGTEE